MEQCATGEGAVLQAGEWNATAEGTQEEVWAQGKARCHCWRGQEEEEGWTARNLPVHMHSGSQRVGCLQCRPWVARSHLLRLQETGHLLRRLRADVG